MYGKNLRKIRQQLRLSQENFGKEFGIGRQGVSDRENERTFLNYFELKMLYDRWGVDLNWFLCGEGESFDAVEQVMIGTLLWIIRKDI